MKLRPYPEYKDSGVPWLGQVPKDWQLVPGLAVLGEKKVKNTGLKETTVLSLSYGKIVIKPAEKLHGLVPESFETYQIVEPGDIIIRGTDLQNDKVSLRIGKVNNRGIITSAYICLYPKNVVDSDYLYLLLHTYDLKKVYYGLGSGLRQNLEFDDFKRLPIALPSSKEQTQIARFLDWKTAQIDGFIRSKRQLIERLKEQKQTLINQIVIGAIDVRTGKPYPEYKESGVPWLGKVPVGWEILPIKRVVRFNPSKSETGDSPSVNKQVCFLPMERISEEGEIDCSEKRQLSEVWEGFTYFRRGDVVLAKITPCFENGKGAYLSELETEYGFGTTELFVLRPTQKIHGAFLRFVTATKTFRWLGAQNMTGAAGQQRVRSSFVKNFQIGLPPLDEQEAIVSFIQHISNSIGTAIARTQREIDLIQEYRTRFIADVVTGKLDVRDIEVPEVDELEEALGEGVITSDSVAQDNLEVAM